VRVRNVVADEGLFVRELATTRHNRLLFNHSHCGPQKSRSIWGPVGARDTASGSHPCQVIGEHPRLNTRVGSSLPPSRTNERRTTNPEGLTADSLRIWRA
jgi:hypothetical protein